MDQLNQDICSIRIMFPVTSDEQAFELRKSIKLLLPDIPESNFDFRIISGRIPTLPAQNDRNR